MNSPTYSVCCAAPISSIFRLGIKATVLGANAGLGEDELVRAEKELDALTRAHVDEIDDALKRKEAELLEV